MSSSSQPPNNGYISLDGGYDNFMRKLRTSLYTTEKETGVIPPLYDENLHRDYLGIGSHFIPDRASLLKNSSLQLSDDDISDEEKQKIKVINEVERKFQANMSSKMAIGLIEIALKDLKENIEKFKIDIIALNKKALLTSEEKENLSTYEESIKAARLAIMSYTSLHKHLTEEVKKKPIMISSKQSIEIWVDHKKKVNELFLEKNKDIQPPQAAPINKHVMPTNNATVSNLSGVNGSPVPTSGGRKTHTKKSKGGFVPALIAAVPTAISAITPAVSSAIATITAYAPYAAMVYAATIMPIASAASATSVSTQSEYTIDQVTEAILRAAKVGIDMSEKNVELLKKDNDILSYGYEKIKNDYKEKYGNIQWSTNGKGKIVITPKKNNDKVEQHFIALLTALKTSYDNTNAALKKVLEQVNAVTSAANNTTVAIITNNSSVPSVSKETVDEIDANLAAAAEQVLAAEAARQHSAASQSMNSRNQGAPFINSRSGPLQPTPEQLKNRANAVAAFGTKRATKLKEVNYMQRPTTNFGMNTYVNDRDNFMTLYGTSIPMAPRTFFNELSLPSLEGFVPKTFYKGYAIYKRQYDAFINELQQKHKDLYNLIQYRSVYNILDGIRIGSMYTGNLEPNVYRSTLLRDEEEVKNFVMAVANKNLGDVRLHIKNHSKMLGTWTVETIEKVVMMGLHNGKWFHVDLKPHEIDMYLTPLLVRFLWSADKLPDVSSLVNELQELNSLPVSLSGFYRTIGGSTDTSLSSLQAKEFAILQPILSYNKIVIDVMYAHKLQKTFDTLSMIKNNANNDEKTRSVAHYVQQRAMEAFSKVAVLRGTDVQAAVEEQLRPLGAALYMLQERTDQVLLREAEMAKFQDRWGNLTKKLLDGVTEIAEAGVKVSVLPGKAGMKGAIFLEDLVNIVRTEIISIFLIMFTLQHPELGDNFPSGFMPGLWATGGAILRALTPKYYMSIAGITGAIIYGEKLTAQVLPTLSGTPISALIGPLIYFFCKKTYILISNNHNVKGNVDAASAANVAADVKEKVVEAKLAAQPSAALSELAAPAPQAMAQSPLKKVSAKVKAAINQKSAAAAAHPEAQPSAALSALAAPAPQAPQKKVSAKILAAIKQKSAAAAVAEPEPEPVAVVKSPTKKELMAAKLHALMMPQSAAASAAAPENDMFSVTHPLSAKSKAVTPPPSLNPIPSPAVSPVGVKQVLKGMIGHTQKDGLPIYPTGPAAASPSPITNLLKTAELKALAKKTAQGGRRTKKRMYKKFRSTRKRHHRR